MTLYAVILYPEIIARLSPETSVTIYQTKRCHILEEMNLHEHCYGNFKSPLLAKLFRIYFDVVDTRFGDRSSTVVKVLCYKSEGRWFNFRWCHWKVSLT